MILEDYLSQSFCPSVRELLVKKKSPTSARHDNRLSELSHNRREVPIKNVVLSPKTNWENLGGSKRSEDMPVHCMAKTNPAESGRGQKEEGGEMICPAKPPRNPCSGLHLG